MQNEGIWYLFYFFISRFWLTPPYDRECSNLPVVTSTCAWQYAYGWRTRWRHVRSSSEQYADTSVYQQSIIHFPLQISQENWRRLVSFWEARSKWWTRDVWDKQRLRLQQTLYMSLSFQASDLYYYTRFLDKSQMHGKHDGWHPSSFG